MASKFTKNHYKGQSLIATNQIRPYRTWCMSSRDITLALQAQGCKVRQIKKVRYLQHQICISYIDIKGGVCSGFFSYRIFERWLMGVKGLIRACSSLREWVQMNHNLQYEFAHYPYPSKMRDAISEELENRLCQLKASALDNENAEPELSDAFALSFLERKKTQAENRQPAFN